MLTLTFFATLLFFRHKKDSGRQSIYTRNELLPEIHILEVFTNYVDKTRQVGGPGKVNIMQFIPYNSVGNPSHMSTRGRQVVKNEQILLNVFCERPLDEALWAKLKDVDPSLTLQKKNFYSSFWLEKQSASNNKGQFISK